MFMDIFIAIVGVVAVILLIILIFKKPQQSKETDLKPLEERLIRLEGQIEKINPSIDHNFRENREEIAKNLDRVSKTQKRIFRSRPY